MNIPELLEEFARSAQPNVLCELMTKLSDLNKQLNQRELNIKKREIALKRKEIRVSMRESVLCYLDQ